MSVSDEPVRMSGTLYRNHFGEESRLDAIVSTATRQMDESTLKETRSA